MIEEIMALPGVRDAQRNAIKKWNSTGGAKSGDFSQYEHEFSYSEGAFSIYIPAAILGGPKDGVDNPLFSTRHFLGSYKLTMEVLSDNKTVLFTLADWFYCGNGRCSRVG